MGKNLVNVVGGPGAAPAPPIDLENGLFRLLARLEQLLTRLSEPAVLQRPTLALQTAVAMVDQAVGFADRWVDADAHGARLTKLLASARDVYNSAEALRSQLSDSVVLSLLKLFAKQDRGESDRADLFRNAMTASCAVLHEAFALFAVCLVSPADGAGWEQANTVFLADLDQLVSKLNT